MVRPFIPSQDYEDLCRWWKESPGWSAIPLDLLPNTGAIAVNPQGQKICAGFLYKTDSKFAWLEFIISDPSYKQADRGEALDLTIENLIDRAKAQGFKAIFTSSNHPKLIQRLQGHNFILTDQNVTHLGRVF